MLHIRIIAVGKLKEGYLQEGIQEYTKRLRSYVSLEIIEVPDQAIPPKTSVKSAELIKKRECDGIRDRLKENEFVVLLDRQGKSMTSEGLATFLEERMVRGSSKIAFIIGGSLGVDSEMKERADWCWSFSELTFPHQLTRLMLMEQVYRACKIQAGETYHK
jgi:23S rRNA (pseudouridine1915-N3)-methyltransferase